MKQIKVVALVLALLSAGACSSAPPWSGGDRESHGRGTVIEGETLRASGGTLLGALAGRVSNFTVNRSGRCPQIDLRGARSIVNGGTPGVYVDQSRFGDTCVLDQIQVRQVDRVEIYPNGHTTRPGYAANPQGLILIFLTRTAAGAP